MSQSKLQLISIYIESNWVALLGATLGVINISITVYHWVYDRAKPVTKSKYIEYVAEDGKEFPVQIKFQIVNIGRRPVIIEALTFLHNNGSQYSHLFMHANGQPLHEKERIQVDFEKMDRILYNYDDDSYAIDAWFVDTMEKKYPVNDAKSNLCKLWNYKSISNE